MESLESYNLIKNQAQSVIYNRHLYVANIVKELFNPQQHKNLCEIGAGKFELATLLAQAYENIDAYEVYPDHSIQGKISNLKIYGGFTSYTNVSKYHLLISVCPYYYCYDEFSDIDTEEVTKNLVMNIIDSSIDKDINSFIVLSNTNSSTDVMKEIKIKNKYNQIAQDNIDLYFERNGRLNTSNNKVLIYRHKI